MIDFKYYAPTKIAFGANSLNELNNLIKEQNVNNVLIHYGSDRVINNGLIDKVEEILDKGGINHYRLGGVVPNPRLSKVYEGIKLCKEHNIDFILAIGGGSVIDSSKAIGYGVASGGDVWDFYAKIRKPDKCLKIGVILTIAAAGSEMSRSSVITNDTTKVKKGYSSDLARPKFAILNPELTYSLPPYQTACGIVDILMHTMERYFNASGTLELTNGIAYALMRDVIKNAYILLKDPNNYNARAEIMWAGSISHNGLTECGSDGGDWATHKLEHELSAKYDIAHGAGLSAIWASWARYVMNEDLHKFALFARNVFNINELNDSLAANKGIEAMENFYRDLKMPTSINELGINPTKEDILYMANQCSNLCGGTCGAIKKLNKEDFIKIYENSLTNF